MNFITSQTPLQSFFFWHDTALMVFFFSETVEKAIYFGWHTSLIFLHLTLMDSKEVNVVKVAKNPLANNLEPNFICFLSSQGLPV